ncbi:hypothetical protein [Bradyrhizobium japonicum]|uniref:hypothetical protein n=1 Tax=Bradyrhizobium japonicum TaxID=375 RepID=UPI0035176E69
MNAKASTSKRSPAGRAEQISVEGRKVAAGRRSDARQRISDTMKSIEQAVIANDGVYPNSKDGKINIQVLLKEAGLNPVYLEKKRPEIIALKNQVRAWLRKLGKVSPGNVDAIRRKVTAKADEARAEADEVRQRYAEAELEHAATLAQLDAARKTIEDLKREKAELLMQLANVIPIDRRAKPK